MGGGARELADLVLVRLADNNVRLRLVLVVDACSGRVRQRAGAMPVAGTCCWCSRTEGCAASVMARTV